MNNYEKIKNMSIEERLEIANDNDWKQIVILFSENAFSETLNNAEKAISDVCVEENITHNSFLKIKEKVLEKLDVFRLYEHDLYEFSPNIKVLETNWKSLGNPKAIKWDLSLYKQEAQDE